MNELISYSFVSIACSFANSHVFILFFRHLFSVQQLIDRKADLAVASMVKFYQDLIKMISTNCISQTINYARENVIDFTKVNIFKIINNSI